jgi:hypothetical protein
MAYIHDTSGCTGWRVTIYCKPSHDGRTECTFKFGSWTYSGNSIDLQLRMEEMNLSEYKEHVVYNLVNATAERNEIESALSSAIV